MENILYKPFEHWFHGGSVYFYSDPHFGDAEVAKKRGISDAEQLKKINSSCAATSETLLGSSKFAAIRF